VSQAKCKLVGRFAGRARMLLRSLGWEPGGRWPRGIATSDTAPSLCVQVAAGPAGFWAQVWSPAQVTWRTDEVFRGTILQLS